MVAVVSRAQGGLNMAPTAAAQERAMKFKDVIVRAMGGELTWWQAADILGVSVRAEVVKGWIQLYRERYRGYNVRHFYARLQSEAGCGSSYTVVRRALQAAGLVKKQRALRPTRRRRVHACDPDRTGRGRARPRHPADAL